MGLLVVQQGFSGIGQKKKNSRNLKLGSLTKRMIVIFTPTYCKCMVNMLHFEFNMVCHSWHYSDWPQFFSGKLTKMHGSNLIGYTCFWELTSRKSWSVFFHLQFFLIIILLLFPASNQPLFFFLSEFLDICGN